MRTTPEEKSGRRRLGEGVKNPKPPPTTGGVPAS